MSHGKAYELGQFEVVAPRRMMAQEGTLEWLAKFHAKAAMLEAGAALDEDELVEKMRQRLRRFGCKPTQIATRGYDTFDAATHDFAADGLYALGPNALTGAVVGPHSSPLGQRSAFFLERSSEVLEAFYPEAGDETPPNHLIHVTCTGYVSPSAPQRLINTRGWHRQTSLTHAYHMGCYAAFPAVRMAEGLARTLAAKGAEGGRAAQRIDIVHTELCTLHLDPATAEPEQLVVHSLFADGHIKYSLTPQGTLKHGFSVLDITEEIVPDSTQDMAWTPDHWGFRMSLSREVPKKIGASIRCFLQRLAGNAGLELGELLKHAQFAIHPGGPRIIDAVQEILELRDDQTAHSKQVLLTRGNMSSATLPHVWKLIDERGYSAGTKVVSLAFGPGLTIFGAVFAVL